MSFNIAIDGPAGAGKSTVAKLSADKLSFLYVDTGAMYRTIALSLLRSDIDIKDERSLTKILDEMEINIGHKDGEQRVYLNGEDVSDLIRTEKVSEMTSRSSAIPRVRDKLTDLQRNIAKKENVIMDGRDIGTMILPNADLKIYLTASVEKRAQRRYYEQMKKGERCTLQQIEDDIRERDYRDSHREIAPLKMAEDAVLIDSSDMTVEEVVDKILMLTSERMSS